MTAARPPLVADPDLVTPEWLTHVLRHAGAIDAATKVASFAATPIGTGQVGANVRYSLSYDRPYNRTGAHGPATVVGKFSSRDEASAAAGVATTMALLSASLASLSALVSLVDESGCEALQPSR